MAKKKVDVKSEMAEPSIIEGAVPFQISIKCKTQAQKEFLNMLKKKQICISNAPAGVGKTYIALSYALKELQNGKIDKIVVVVPTCEAGGSSLKIGLLPGTYEEKIEVYRINIKNVILQILSDSGNVDCKSLVNKLFNTGLISFRILNFMRGCSIKNAVLYADECENFNKAEILLLLTRIQNSQVILTGDIAQNDRKDTQKDCGLTYAIDHLKNMEEVGVCYFSENDIVRDKLITKILQNWRNA